MKTTRKTKTILVTAVVLMAGATLAFAHGGWDRDDYGYGGNMRGYHMMGPGNGGYHMAGPGYGRGYGAGYANLSKEEAAKIDAARDKFFDETRDLRRNIDDKAYELRKALDNENPDTATVKSIQKELSKLRSDFDQKRIEHRIEMRKLLPEDFQGPGMGYGRGRGGYCWR